MHPIPSVRTATTLLGLLAAAAVPAAPTGAQEATRTPRTAVDAPLFADVWVGGALDSIYNAEYARLQEACEPADTACFEAELDTGAVALAPVRTAPDAPVPSGRLMAALRPRGRYPYATLLYRPDRGPDITIREDLGDWGYGTTLTLADTADGWIRLLVPEVAAPVWLPRSGEARGFGVVEVYGLDDRLWTLGPVPVAARDDGAEVALPRDVYRVLEVGDGVVRLRPEVPSDMPCGEVAPDPAAVPTYVVPLDRFVDDRGVPLVEPAYPKGC